MNSSKMTMASGMIHQELKSGGWWLLEARTWMQSNVPGGDTLTWGSPNLVTIPFHRLEDLALRAAVGALAEYLEKEKVKKEVTDIPTAKSGKSTTDGMNLQERILHVGGRNNAAGYVEFGSVQAVRALILQVIGDLAPVRKRNSKSESVVCDEGDGQGVDQHQNVQHLPEGTDWERVARVQNAKLMAMCDEPGGFEKLCEVMDRYERKTPQVAQQGSVVIDNIVSEAMRRYLRRCSSGGMSSENIEIVQANVDEAERLNYFRVAIAKAILADRQKQANRIAELEGLSVTNIMLDIQPGEDGMGQEIFAESVKDVVDKLTEISQRLEDWELGIKIHPSADHKIENLQAEIESMKLSTPQENTSPDLGMADVWHEGSESFYRARLITKITPEEALYEPDTPLQKKEECTNADKFNCKYCNKTSSCPILKDTDAPEVVPVSKTNHTKHVPGEWFIAKDTEALEEFFKSRLEPIREAARTLGYSIGLHGSMRRDLDLIAVPWVDEHASPDELAMSIAKAACGIYRKGPYSWEQKPSGRIATSIPICWAPPSTGGPGMGHIDLSVVGVDLEPKV